jgi:hypothetical protein
MNMTLRIVIQLGFESKLDQIVERTESLERLPSFLPNTHFAPPACEARQMYRMGYYYGSIMVSQATAEALARYIAEAKHLPDSYFIEQDKRNGGVSQAERIEYMKQQKVISMEAFKHFRKILNHKRNSFHHMNSDVPVENKKLKTMAFECVASLYSIEGAFLGFGRGGKVVVNDTELWDVKPDGSVAGFIDLERI